MTTSAVDAEAVHHGPAGVLPPGSRVLLIGTATYTDERLPPLPAVAGNLADLAELVTTLGGLPQDRVHTLLDRGAELTQEVKSLADGTSGVLLCYFAGHGFYVDDGELYLGLPNTRQDSPKYSGLSYALIRDALTSQRKADVVIFVDCCYSGLAHAVPYATPGSRARLQGARSPWVFTAGGGTEAAYALPGERNTEFTRRLIATIRSGVPGAGELLTANLIRDHLQDSPDTATPEPRHSGTAVAGDIPLFRNPAPDAADEVATADAPTADDAPTAGGVTGPAVTPSEPEADPDPGVGGPLVAVLVLAIVLGVVALLLPFDDMHELSGYEQDSDRSTLANNTLDDQHVRHTSFGWETVPGTPHRPAFQLPGLGPLKVSGRLRADFEGAGCPGAAMLSVTFGAGAEQLAEERLTPADAARTISLSTATAARLGLRIELEAPADCRAKLWLDDARVAGPPTSMFERITRG
ncbi:hypothetical protein GCM10010193_04830 [Kitasatospora atroaurantiaca]|uniref:Caspase domain-containing protein n=1 Tax=Kitasatospora atroaurantiaca TaxID=285545 RepID=A0A561EMA8_9ACTN|nr:caspase family protein [Kitasatospora atroaurantiaca]TWE16699.1 caspase domain-containing protein [Kitasatospora atroaurantiaca]